MLCHRRCDIICHLGQEMGAVPLHRLAFILLWSLHVSEVLVLSFSCLETKSAEVQKQILSENEFSTAVYYCFQKAVFGTIFICEIITRFLILKDLCFPASFGWMLWLWMIAHS